MSLPAVGASKAPVKASRFIACRFELIMVKCWSGARPAIYASLQTKE